jgi:hypothetical protein
MEYYNGFQNPINKKLFVILYFMFIGILQMVLYFHILDVLKHHIGDDKTISTNVHVGLECSA